MVNANHGSPESPRRQWGGGDAPEPGLEVPPSSQLSYRPFPGANASTSSRW
jgi:hypothetical protein